MATRPSDVHRLPLTAVELHAGPVTTARQRRTLIVYATVCIVGLVPALIGASSGWQAAGLGLWMPGAGFVAVGGWAVLLFPIVLALFGVSLIAWFWAGMVIAPLTVWLGSAAIAGAMAGDSTWSGAHLFVALCMAATGYYVRMRAQRNRVRDEQKADRRLRFLPASLAEVEVRAAAVPDASTREMTSDQLASLRYVLDRSLQPVDQFNGFDVIDQFQPAALRYQLNHMGFALGLAQGAYTPNFHGYMHAAQRNLIDKYLLKRVWSYWVYESCWGHFNFTNFDPAARDNIMLTGWLGMHVGQYMLNSGDRRYAEPGSLTFRLNDRTAYPHDIHSVVGSVAENYTRYEKEFCIYPCEPNWMYPICNHYGMTALATHDRLFGTSYVAHYLPAWQQKLDSEFTDASGSIIGLRSQLTGFQFPFPTGEAGYAHFANCFTPERARRLWAVARKEIEPAMTQAADGKARISLPGKGLDAGNYTRGFTATFGALMLGAREFGDDEIAAAAQHSLDLDCGLKVDDGVRRYVVGSNLANVSTVMGRLMRVGDFRRSFVEGPSEASLKGPVLTGVKYPDVLVARAFSRGDDLDLVLYGNGAQTITIERLQPGRAYAMTGPESLRLDADASGRAVCAVNLSGRTSIRFAPL